MTVPIIRVDNRLRVPLADLPDGIAEALKAECSHKNPTFYKQQRMGFKAWKEHPIITTWKEQAGVLTLPRGSTASVRQVFERHDLPEPEWDDCRTLGNPEIGVLKCEHSIDLWDHQERVVNAALERENCLVRAPTGAGKTTAAIELAVRCGLPTLIVVWSSNLFDQWVERLCSELGLTKNQIGIIRGSKRTLAPITMAMQQTLYANPKLVRMLQPKFGCVMADEVQRFAARTFMDVVDAFPARYRIGWSADETRKDRKEFLIYDVFGSVAADIDRGELVRKQLVHDVEVRIIPTEFTAQWYVDAMRSEESNADFNALLDAMVADSARNKLITTWARTEMVFGNQVLALCHRREHAMMLVREKIREGLRAGLLLGGSENAKEFADTVKQMRDRSLNYAAGTYQAIGQGLDIPSVQRGIACTPIASNRQFFGQVRGRLCRRADGKRDAVLYYLWDQHVFGIEPIRKLQRWNKVVKVRSNDKSWIHADEYVDDWNRTRRS